MFVCHTYVLLINLFLVYEFSWFASAILSLFCDVLDVIKKKISRKRLMLQCLEND